MTREARGGRLLFPDPVIRPYAYRGNAERIRKSLLINILRTTEADPPSARSPSGSPSLQTDRTAQSSYLAKFQAGMDSGRMLWGRGAHDLLNGTMDAH